VNANSISSAGRFAGKVAFSTGAGIGAPQPWLSHPRGADVVGADVAYAEKPYHGTGRMG
jgi:hypothetical protein